MQPQAQAPIRIGGLEIRYLVDGTVSKTATGMFELTIEPGSRVPPAHSHSANEEIIYVLEGKVRYTVGEETRDLGPGERMHTPRGVTHAFSNPHDKPVRALIMLTPDIGAQYFRDIAAIVSALGGPDPGKMAAMMTKYGLVIAKPR